MADVGAAIARAGQLLVRQVLQTRSVVGGPTNAALPYKTAREEGVAPLLVRVLKRLEPGRHQVAPIHQCSLYLRPLYSHCTGTRLTLQRLTESKTPPREQPESTVDSTCHPKKRSCIKPLSTQMQAKLYSSLRVSSMPRYLPGPA